MPNVMIEKASALSDSKRNTVLNKDECLIATSGNEATSCNCARVALFECDMK